MKKNLYLCVDLKTQMKRSDLQVMDCRKGTLCRNGEDKFTFTEKGAHRHEIQPEKHWLVLDKCRYGKVSANDSHVKLELYIPHTDYANSHELADILGAQVDQMGDNLCEMKLSEVVNGIKALKK
jgi:hypothetical protein